MKKTHKKTTRSPVQERAQATVDAILTATTQILDKEGIEAASTNRIAAKAGVGIGSLYQYFRNKDQIVASITEILMSNKLNVLKAALLESNAKTLKDGVAVVIHALIEAKIKNARLESILERQVPKMGVAYKLLQKADEVMIKTIIEFFQPYKKEMKTQDLEQSVFVVVQALKGVMVMTNQNRPEYFQSRKFEQTLTAMVMAALQD